MELSEKTISVELKVPTPRPLRLAPARTALVIIDMENDFAHPKGVACFTQRRTAVIEPIRALTERFRAAHAPVIWVQSIRDPDSPEFTVFGLKPFILRNTWGSEFVAPLGPSAGEPVVEKNSHDCFNSTRIEHVLASRGIRPGEWTIVVVGLGLANCVGCAAVGFSVRNYWVAIPMDCTASSTWEDDIVLYQHYLQGGLNYNVALTQSALIELA